MKRRLTSAMKAVLVREFGGVEVMKVENDVAVPPIGNKQVLLKVEVSGVNPVDTYIRDGQYVKLPDLPYIPGRDGAGIVERVGPSVTRFKPGDRVYCANMGRWGTLAEFTSVDESFVFPLPPSLTFQQGAALGIPYFTAFRALFHKAGAKRGERLLIHGASGAVGLAAVQIAKSHGLEVVGTAGTEAGLKLVKQTGADSVLNHRQRGYLDTLAAGDKFDVILEMLANVNLRADLPLMKLHGRTVVVGSRGTVTINPRDLMGSESCVMGVALFTATLSEWEELGTRVDEGIKAGWISPVIDKVYTLNQAREAHNDIIHSSGAKGNLVVQIRE